MSVELIGAIAFVVGFIGLFVGQNFLVYVFLGSTLLGAAAALILDSLGGTTIQPAHLLLGFLTVKLLASRENRAGAVKAMSLGSPGFWLLVTTKIAVLRDVFASQRSKHWFDEETFRGLMRIRGLESNTRYAESFVARKFVIA